VPPAGTNGWIIIGDGDVCPPRLPAPMAHWDEVDPNYVLTFTYRDPDFRIVPPVIMQGTILPKRIVSESDMPAPPKLWHEEQPSRGGGTFNSSLRLITY